MNQFVGLYIHTQQNYNKEKRRDVDEIMDIIEKREEEVEERRRTNDERRQQGVTPGR